MDYNKTIKILRDRNSQLLEEIDVLKKQLEEMNNENKLEQARDAINQTFDDYSKLMADLSNIKNEYQEKMDELRETILSLKTIREEKKDFDDKILDLKIRI